MKIEELKIDDCRKALEKTNLARLACSLDDQPYIVPFSFVFDNRNYLYCFSTGGQKICWMRKNPLVCVEIEDIKNSRDWTTLVIFGRYEELPDEPNFEDQRIRAHELLSRRPMWWQPTYTAGMHREQSDEKPVYFRIYIEKITGHRAVSDSVQANNPVEATEKIDKNSWHTLY